MISQIQPCRRCLYSKYLNVRSKHTCFFFQCQLMSGSSDCTWLLIYRLLMIHFNFFCFSLLENYSNYHIHLIHRNHWRFPTFVKEFGLADFHGLDSNFLTMACKEFFAPFDFIHERICLNVVGK